MSCVTQTQIPQHAWKRLFPEILQKGKGPCDKQLCHGGRQASGEGGIRSPRFLEVVRGGSLWLQTL
jgi:hypothetical protein